MIRITRSRKVDIAEDSTAIAIETPLPDTPIQQLPLNDISSASGVNNMAAEASSVPSHIKHLKEAYRNAIGAKKNKKNKNKKKDLQDLEHGDVAIDGDNVNNENTPQGQTPEYDLPVLPNPAQGNGLSSLLDTLTAPNLVSSPITVVEEQQSLVQPTTGRITRRQLQQQAGQYSPLSSPRAPEPLFSSNKRDYSSGFKSLFAALHAGSHGTSKVSQSQPEHPYQLGMTDRYLSLAKEALAKSTNEVNNLIPLEDEPAEKKVAYEQDIQIIETPVKEVTRTPSLSAIRTLDDVEQACADEHAKSLADSSDDDSFVAQIISRSPAKSITRIEDSVEALDQLEDAMDALAQATLAQGMVSPMKAQHAISLDSSDPPENKRLSREISPEPIRKANPPKQAAPKSGYASMRMKSTATKPSPSLRKSASMSFRPSVAESKKATEEQKSNHPLAKTHSKRPISLMPPKEPVKSTKPPTRSNFELPGEAVARRLKEQREARLAKREAEEQTTSTSVTKTVRSTKPITRPNFELPGEALSRRKREAHETRLKAQEEEERKRREFKARPVRKSVVPDHVPRETATSRARQSTVGTASMDIHKLSISNRNSVVGAHRPSIQQLNLANPSSLRAPRPKIARKPSTTSGPSMSGLALQRSVSDKDAHLQRQRGKEVYNRDAKLTEEMEREKQEREAAAKRARETAAERGRQASREWAEKQRAKKLTAGDKGMSIGYGPGGQMGLRY